MSHTPIQAQAMTKDEFRVLAANGDHLLELIHGEVVEKMPTELHGKLAALIAYFLLTFIRTEGIAAHVGVEVRHEAPDDAYNSRLPDVSARLSIHPPQQTGAVSRMPDLAVEIQSPADRPHQVRQKALYYLQKGCAVVWLIYPIAQRADVCQLDEAGNLAIAGLAREHALTAEAALPGFTLPLEDLFEDIG
ncbi:MAG: Uma2 family endonuclease [Anaerolineales bacterium]